MNFIKTTICVFFLLILANLSAQDGSLTLQYDNALAFEEAIYTDNQGLYVISSSTSNANRIWKYAISKVAFDLSNSEWTTEFETGMYNRELVFDQNNPSHFYLIANVPRVTKLTKTKKQLIQIGVNGKKKEIPYDKGYDDLLYATCDGATYSEIRTEKKKEELFLIDYEHTTMRPKTSTINIGAWRKDKGYTSWVCSGRKGNIVCLYRYGKKKNKGTFSLKVIDTKNKKVVNDFIFTPNLREAKVAPCQNMRYPIGIEGKLTYDIASNANGSERYARPSYGSVALAANGKSFYFYSLISYSGKRNMSTGAIKPDGYIIQNVDFNGKVLWSKEEKIKPAEAGNAFNKHKPGNIKLSFTVNPNDGSMVLSAQYLTTFFNLRKLEYSTLSRQYSANGELLNKCIQGHSYKPNIYVRPASKQAQNLESVLPCFPKGDIGQVLAHMEKQTPSKSEVYIAKDGVQGAVLFHQKNAESKKIDIRLFRY